MKLEILYDFSCFCSVLHTIFGFDVIKELNIEQVPKKYENFKISNIFK